MSKTWRCGDCGTEYPKSQHYCGRRFNDYIAIRGGSIETAINRAVETAIAPLAAAAERRLTPRPKYFVWRWANTSTKTGAST